MSCEDTRDLLELYALDVLDSSDRDKVELHLSGCAECRLAASEAQEITEQLPQILAAAAPLRPPSDLKERLLSAISVNEQPKMRSSRQMGIRAIRWKRLLRPRIVSAVVGVLLLAFSIGWSVHLSVAIAQERALRAEFADLVDQQEIVLEVVDSRNTVKRVLRPPAEGSTSYGKLFTRTDMVHVVSMAGRLDPAPSGEAYHLWLTKGDQTRLAGTLTVNDEGFGLLVMDADEVGPDYDIARLTLQPEGSTSPSESTVLIWRASP